MHIRETAVLAIAAAVAFGSVAASGQRPPAVVAPQPSVESHHGELMTSRCAALSEHDARLIPLSRLCEFAQSYRASLPNFICEQQTVSKASWLGAPPKTVVDEVVTFQDGNTIYSNVRIDGKPQPPKAYHQSSIFSTSGEFGSELVDLFTTPDAIEFRFHKRTAIDGRETLEFTFHLPQEKNVFWQVADGARAILPGFHGEVRLDAHSGKLLRLSNEPENLPRNFVFQSARKVTEYGDVPLGEAGIHLLPVRGESHACLRYAVPRGAMSSLPHCITNELTFHGCRRFGAKAKIVDTPQ